jgi:hypothetical protein
LLLLHPGYALTSVVLLPLAPWIKLFMSHPAGDLGPGFAYAACAASRQSGSEALLLKADGSVEVMLADGYCFDAGVSAIHNCGPG